MKCPKCGNPTYKYADKKRYTSDGKLIDRKTYKTHCNKCNHSNDTDDNPESNEND